MCLFIDIQHTAYPTYSMGFVKHIPCRCFHGPNGFCLRADRSTWMVTDTGNMRTAVAIAEALADYHLRMKNALLCLPYHQHVASCCTTEFYGLMVERV